MIKAQAQLSTSCAIYQWMFLAYEKMLLDLKIKIYWRCECNGYLHIVVINSAINNRVSQSMMAFAFACKWFKMEDSVVTELEAVNERKEDYEPFTNPEDIALCNYFIPDLDESSDCSDSDDADNDHCFNDEVVEIISEENDENNHNQ